MLPDPIEPENYSIDEMMERLQGKGSDSDGPNGELVTRSDGSQAVRVRKRKRRSSQPQKTEKKTNQKLRVIQLTVAIVTLLMIGLFLIGFTLYTNSTPYREGLLRKIGISSGAEATLNEFRVSPTGAHASSATFTWPEGNILRNLQLSEIRAEISPLSFVGKSWNGEEISAKRGKLILGSPASGADKPPAVMAPGSRPVSFDRFEVLKLDVIMGQPAEPSLQLLETEASLYPKNISGRPELRLNRGKLIMKGWPNLRLNRALMEIRGPETEIISMRVYDQQDERGIFELSGTLHPFNSTQPSTLALGMQSYLLDALTGSGLKDFFSGRVDSRPVADSNYLTFVPTESDSVTLTVAFNGTTHTPVEISKFPFLHLFAQAFGDEWFKRPVFDTTSSGIFHREDGNDRLSDLNFESKGRMAVKGDVQTTKDGKLQGTLKIGISEANVAASPAPRLGELFSQPSNGFRWITLEISGTPSQPVDNFEALYHAAGNNQPPAATTSPTDSKVPSFEDLTRPK